MKRFFGKTNLQIVLFVLMFVLSASTAFAQWTDPLTGVEFTATSGSAGNTNETYDKICDNNTGTKFCGNFVSGSGWVIVHASQPVKLSGYSLYTANDSEGNSGRNPKSWTIEGSNDGTNWTKFVTVTNNTDMGARNYKEYTFTCTAPDAYTYFRFTMTALQNGTLFQISEFHPHVYMPSVTANAGYVMYSGSNYLTTNTDGTGTFNPSACLWTGTSGSYFKNGAYYINLGNTNTLSTTNQRAMDLQGTESGTTGQKVKRHDNESWLRYYNSVWTKTGTSTDGGTNVAFSVTKNTYSAVEFAPTVTTTKTTFSDVDESSTYTHTNASYRPSFYDYVFYNNTNHYCLTETSNATATPPAAETFTYTWNWESAPEAGHVTLNTTTGKVTYENLFATDTRLRLKLTAQSTTSSKIFTVYSDEILFEAPKVDPTSVSATDMTVYVGKSQNASVTLTPNPCYRHLEFSSANTGIAAVDNTGVVTGVSVGNTTVTVKAYKIDNTYFTTTFNVTVKGKVATPEISFAQKDSDNGATATASITCTTDGSSIYYTTDGSTPTSESTLYNGSFSVENNKTVKAVAIKDVTGWENSEVATNTYVRRVLPTPTIQITNGSVTFTCSEPGVTFRYTTGATNPTDPTPSTTTTWTEGSTPITTGITNEHTIKVIATKSGWSYSPVASRQYIQASGVSGGVVSLNDYEDHNWSYYSDPESPIKSLYPRNVKITYYGYGTNTMTTNNNNPGTTNMTNVASTAVGVSMYESENTFVYYKTLERYVPITNLVEGTSQNIYPYDLIPNPFSKRPTYGTNADTKWRGFYGWRVKSISDGKIYSNANKTGEITTGTILTTEYQKLYFLPDDAGATNANNATSMTVEFEAVWTRAYRVATSVADVDDNLANTNFSEGVSYERNFLVINDGTTSTDNLTTNLPVTVMMVEPDGSTDYRANTRYINPAYVIPTNNIKFEWMNMRVSNTLSANAKNLVVGRGVKANSGANNNNLGDMAATGTNPNPTNTALRVHGLGSTTSNTNSDYSTSVNYYLRLESGVYDNVYYVSSTNGSRGQTTGSATLHVTGFFGNDYDRAKNDNNRLVAKTAVLEGTNNGFNNTSSALMETMMLTVKSGTTGTNYNKEIYSSTYAPSPTNAFYTAVGSGAKACGLRRTNFEGGSIHCLTGGMEVWDGTHTDKAYNSNKLITDIHIRNNTIIRSAAFGGPANAAHYGLRRMVYTGGQVNGWVAGACNGDSDNGGQLYGTTQVYVGGNAKIGDASHTITVNGSASGNVFGAGRGRSSSVTTGEVAYGTNVVIADNAVVLQNVYGGGDLGYALETANVHVLGGEVKGSVFGGANQKKGENANIVVRGGLIRGGVYGGCNTSGELSGDVTIQINGGQIGVSGTPANVHGGGYGQPTRVMGNVDITLGTITSGVTAGSAVVYGDVYGGSALGYVNGTAVSTTKHTNVTLNGGDVYGAVYGGGLGDGSNAANVYAPVKVTINGGSATNVFGCNNTNGRPRSTVNVNMTGGLVRECVYGGGNAAGYTGTPHVAISGGEVDKHVFGGGLGANAVVTGDTDVKVTEAEGATTLIGGNVYGGGNAALVTGDTHVQIGEE